LCRSYPAVSAKGASRTHDPTDPRAQTPSPSWRILRAMPTGFARRRRHGVQGRQERPPGRREFVRERDRRVSTERSTSPAEASSASRSDSTESLIPPTPRRSPENVDGPSISTPRMTPLQRLPRNVKARASAASQARGSCVTSPSSATPTPLSMALASAL